MRLIFFVMDRGKGGFGIYVYVRGCFGRGDYC